MAPIVFTVALKNNKQNQRVRLAKIILETGTEVHHMTIES